MRAYVAALAALALLLVASFVYWYGVPVDVAHAIAAVGVAALLILADRLRIRVDVAWQVSTLDVALVAGVLAVGPLWTALAALPCMLYAAGRELLRAAYEPSRATVEVLVAGIILSAVAAPLSSGVAGSAAMGAGAYQELLPGSSPFVLCYAAAAATAGLLTVNHAGSAMVRRLKYGEDFAETYRAYIQPYLPSDLLSVVTVALGALALALYGPVAAFVAVGGCLASQLLVYRTRDSEERHGELQEENRKLKSALQDSTAAFGRMIVRDLGRRDGFTHRHAAATAVYARDLAVEMRLGSEKAREIATAGLLHNVGLSSVSPEVLSAAKPNSLAREELERHPGFGEEILSSVPGFEEAARWVRWHHERPDGRGYPDRLRGPWIPTEAKILAVAAAYAGMVLDKPTDPARSPAQAREALTSGIGTAFDEETTKALLRILDTASEGYQAADDHRFVFSATPGSVPPEQPPGELEPRKSTGLGPVPSD